MLKWHKLEVRELHDRPDHPVALQGIEVCAVQLVLRARALHDSHTRQEYEQVGTSKHSLIRSDSSRNFEVWLARNDHLFLKEAEPLGSCWTEDSASVEGHATRAREVLVLQSLLLDQLLSHCVASCEEHRGGDGLGEERTGGQLSLVPVEIVFSSSISQDKHRIAHTIAEQRP